MNYRILSTALENFSSMLFIIEKLIEKKFELISHKKEEEKGEKNRP